MNMHLSDDMSGPQKIDVEVRNGLVVAVWFGCLHLPFEQHEVGSEREDNMNDMYGDLYKSINEGRFKPMDIFQERLEGQAYGYDDQGNVLKPPVPYAPPSDEITSREA